jgi:hypothetical protein
MVGERSPCRQWWQDRPAEIGQYAAAERAMVKVKLLRTADNSWLDRRGFTGNATRGPTPSAAEWEPLRPS